MRINCRVLARIFFLFHILSFWLSVSRNFDVSVTSPTQEALVLRAVEAPTAAIEGRKTTARRRIVWRMGQVD